MDDQGLEARLRACRPANPPAELRARVVDAGLGARRLQPSAGSSLAWLPAVAALLLATIFYWLAASDRERLFAQFPSTDADETIELHLENQP